VFHAQVHLPLFQGKRNVTYWLWKHPFLLLLPLGSWSEYAREIRRSRKAIPENVWNQKSLPTMLGGHLVQINFKGSNYGTLATESHWNIP
jgi:hypothetical protein